MHCIEFGKEMKFRHVYQGAGTKLCGQACIASILGISLEKAIELVGHANGTTSREMAKALGIEGGRKRGDPKIPSLLSVREGTIRNWHWVILDGENTIDPALPYIVEYATWLEAIGRLGQRVSSYLDLSLYYKEAE